MKATEKQTLQRTRVFWEAVTTALLASLNIFCYKV